MKGRTELGKNVLLGYLQGRVSLEEMAFLLQPWGFELAREYSANVCLLGRGSRGGFYHIKILRKLYNIDYSLKPLLFLKVYTHVLK